LSFPSNQQAVALAWVFELGGVLSEHGNLSEIPVAMVANQMPCTVTRFNQRDLNNWDCIVCEAEPFHWAVQERDTELARLRAEVSVLRAENVSLQNEALHFNQKGERFLIALEELKKDRDRLRKELGDAAKSEGPVSWSEWGVLRGALSERDQYIMQLKSQLVETSEIPVQFKNGNDQGRLMNENELLGRRVKELEMRLMAEYEGGLVYDEGKKKSVETDGRTWTLVHRQAKELALYRSTFGSISTRDCFGEPDFSINVLECAAETPPFRA
jgi:hypothetical protein